MANVDAQFLKRALRKQHLRCCLERKLFCESQEVRSDKNIAAVRTFFHYYLKTLHLLLSFNFIFAKLLTEARWSATNVSQF